MTWARAPLAPPALAFAGGIALAPWLSPTSAWTVWAIGLVWGASLAALGRLPAGGAFVLIAVAALGVLRGTPAPPPPDDVGRLALPAIAHVEGRVAGEPAVFAPDRVRVVVDVRRVDGRPRSGLVQLTIAGQAPPLANGQRIAGEIKLYAASGFRNPGVFDRARYLERHGIAVVGSARADRLTTLDEPRPPWHTRVRRAAGDAIERALPPVSAALLEGLLLGERSGLPREIDDAFRRAGVYHILAVSGFNVALIAGTVFALLTLARLRRRPTALIAIVAVVGFALVAGPEASVLRAAVMGVLVLGAILLDREASVVNGLALAALVLLAARPGDLADPGFQLSFAATGGIVLAPLPRGWLGGALGASAAAQLAVLPIGLAHFNQVSTVGVLANLAVVPLAGLATIVGFLAIVAGWVSDVAGTALVNAAWPPLLALRALVALAAAVPGALVHLPAPGWPAIAAYVLALTLALLAWHRRSTRADAARVLAGSALTSLAAAVALAAWPLLRPPDGRLRLTVLDVGQGDALVLETPNGRAVLVDAGPGGPMRVDTGERVVSPFLWNRGFLTLAAVVTTHADQDHAGGMAAVRRGFAIGETLAPGRRYWIDGVSLLALADRSGMSRNETALVVRVDHGVTSFLLASDIPATTEAALLAGGAPLAASVLKVAHHGSAGSSTAAFLDRVRPVAAVVSVGRRNPYGHPSGAALARLGAVGARVYRTDRDGAVIVESDGGALTITGWASGRADHYCLDPERPHSC